MKTFLCVAILLLIALPALSPQLAAFAQAAQAADGADVQTVTLFAWAAENPPNWSVGVLYAVLGLFGALVTMYSLIGGSVPGTSGSVQIDIDARRLEVLSKRLETLISSDAPDAAVVAAVDKAVDNLRDDLNAEKRRQFVLAFALYTILGAFFAMLLAQDLLQAILIGAGWTGIVGSLGIKNDYEKRTAIKDDVLKEIETSLKSVRTAPGAAAPQPQRRAPKPGHAPPMKAPARPPGSVGVATTTGEPSLEEAMRGEIDVSTIMSSMQSRTKADDAREIQDFKERVTMARSV